MKTACASNSPDAAEAAIFALIEEALLFLSTCERIPLTSKVYGKKYHAYLRRDATVPCTRPARDDLFLSDPVEVRRLWDAWHLDRAPVREAAAALYTVALAPCLALELFDRQNKKGPATYFECVIGHIAARALDRLPNREAVLPVRLESVRLTMDFLFPPTEASHGVHLAVKMSTRERVVQAWAHQRMLDVAFAGQYLGALVIFGETKLDSRTREVVEICVPDQWLAYQSLLAPMKRIFYFDAPQRYKTLALAYPDFIVLPSFAEFRSEMATLLVKQ